MDLRMLIKAEEELSQTNGFSRLFPSAKSHQYFKYFYRDGIPYYDRLLDAWEHKYGHNRAKGIRTLRKYCNSHLSIEFILKSNGMMMLISKKLSKIFSNEKST